MRISPSGVDSLCGFVVELVNEIASADDVRGGRDHTRRADDRCNGDQRADDLLEVEACIRSAKVEVPGSGLGVHCDERDDLRELERLRIETRDLDCPLTVLRVVPDCAEVA